MKLQEKHKEFAVRCFARFMTRTEVVEAFIEEFADDLSPPEISKLPQVQIDMEILEEQLGREATIASDLEWYQERYEELYGSQAKEKFEADYEKIRAEAEAEHPPSDYTSETAQEHYEKHQEEVEEHNERVKRELSNQLRRLNRTHCQFPEKYRDLFDHARKEYFSSYQSENLQNPENVTFELETLYGYVKQRVFKEENPTAAMQHVTLAHQILKTIVACNALDAKQEVVDVTPQDAKAVKEAQKSVAD